VCSLHSHVNLYLVGINSREENKELTATRAVWKSNKVERKSHFSITNTNLFIIPKLVEFLSRVNKYVVFLTGFTNIASLHFYVLAPLFSQRPSGLSAKLGVPMMIRPKLS
jgi:hypothetical protein